MLSPICTYSIHILTRHTKTYWNQREKKYITDKKFTSRFKWDGRKENSKLKQIKYHSLSEKMDKVFKNIIITVSLKIIYKNQLIKVNYEETVGFLWYIHTTKIILYHAIAMMAMMGTGWITPKLLTRTACNQASEDGNESRLQSAATCEHQRLRISRNRNHRFDHLFDRKWR